MRCRFGAVNPAPAQARSAAGFRDRSEALGKASASDYSIDAKRYGGKTVCLRLVSHTVCLVYLGAAPPGLAKHAIRQGVKAKGDSGFCPCRETRGFSGWLGASLEENNEMKLENQQKQDYRWVYVAFAAIVLIAVIAMVKSGANEKEDPAARQLKEETAWKDLERLKDLYHEFEL